MDQYGGLRMMDRTKQSPRPVNLTEEFSMKTTQLLLSKSIIIALCTSAAAQERPGKHDLRYRLVDLGTFGGPASYFPNGFDGILNNHGTAVGGANTSTPDPFCFPAPSCFAEHAFL